MAQQNTSFVYGDTHTSYELKSHTNAHLVYLIAAKRTGTLRIEHRSMINDTDFYILIKIFCHLES